MRTEVLVFRNLGIRGAELATTTPSQKGLEIATSQPRTPERARRTEVLVFRNLGIRGAELDYHDAQPEGTGDRYESTTDARTRKANGGIGFS